MQDTFDQAQKLINFLSNLEQTGQNEEINRNDYKQYKNASQAEKAKILVDSNELKKLEDGLSNNKVYAKTKGYLPDAKLFQSVHKRIYEILKTNYLPEFYQKVLQIPTRIYQVNSCKYGLRFNSVGEDIVDLSHNNKPRLSGSSEK